jgi:hypothetical protein
MLPALQAVATYMLQAGHGVDYLHDMMDALSRVALMAAKSMIDAGIRVGELGQKVPGLSKLFGENTTEMRSAREASTWLGGAIKGLEQGTGAATVAVTANVAAMKPLPDLHAKVTKAVADHAKAIQSITDKLSGAGAIKAATDMLEALRKLPPMYTLTRDSQLAIAKTMGEAIEVYEAAGKTIPEAWLLTANAARIASATTVASLTSIIDEVNKLKTIKIEIPIAPIPTLQIVKGLQELPGVIVGMPSIPKLPLFEKIFGTATEFGQQMASTVMGAIQGGGNILGAATGMVGSKIGSSIAGSLTKEGGPLFKTALGGIFSSTLPVIGSLIGPLATKIWDSLFGTAGRDAVKDFAATFHGGFDGPDGLHAALNTLGAEGEVLWKKLTQGVGRNNPEQAAAVIKEVTAALDAQKNKQVDVASAAVAASAAQIEAQHKALDAVTALDNQIRSLSDSIAGEAPEEFMGIVEMQTRARIEGLTKEREAAQSSLENLSDIMTGSIDRVGDAIRSLPKSIAFELDILRKGGDTSGAATGGFVGFGKVIPFATGGMAPMGTDTVPAMLTPGEAKLSERSLAALRASTSAKAGPAAPQRIAA